MISQSSIEEVVDKMDAAAVVGDYTRLENRGGRFMGLCPFHNEKTPSFSVNTDLKLYHCFGCGKGGTVISFVMEMDKLSFPEAIEHLAKRFGVVLRYENTGSPEDQKVSKSEELCAFYQRIAGTFHYFLTKTNEGKRALDYVLSRGIEMDIVEQFRLGYAPANRYGLFAFCRKKNYSEEFLASTMLFSRKYPRISFLSDRLVFPINDRHGKTIAFGGRLLSGEGAKYLNTAESLIYKKGQTLFAIDIALPEIKKTKEVFIAEGYIDALALHQAGVANAVAPLGTAFTDDQARLLRKFADRVNLVFDSDSAGQDAAVKAILTCRRNGLIAGVVSLETDSESETRKEPFIKMKDPADILKEFGKKVLKSCVNRVILDFDYLVARSKMLFNTAKPEEKSKAAAFLFPYLETLDSEVVRDSAVDRLAGALRVDREAVRNDFETYKQRNSAFGAGKPRFSPENAKSPKVHLNDELFLLAVVAVNDSLYPQFRARLSITEIEDPAAKDIFIALEDCFAHDETGMDALLPRISSEGARAFIIEHGASNEFMSHPEQLVSDGVKRIKQKRIERRLAKIVTELRLLESESADDGNPRVRYEELLLEKIHIDAELRRLKEEKV
jgi:DNA primase